MCVHILPFSDSEPLPVCNHVHIHEYRCKSEGVRVQQQVILVQNWWMTWSERCPSTQTDMILISKSGFNKCCFIIVMFVHLQPWVCLYEWQIQTTATWWYAELPEPSQRVKVQLFVWDVRRRSCRPSLLLSLCRWSETLAKIKPRLFLWMYPSPNFMQQHNYDNRVTFKIYCTFFWVNSVYTNNVLNAGVHV